MGALGFCQAGSYPVYVLCCLLAAYLLNQLDRYVLAIVIQPLAQDLEFGDRSCLSAGGAEGSKVQCRNASSQESCLSFHSENQTQYCQWNYDGTGWEYQIMAGPVFVLVYTLTGIVVGFMADSVNRKNFLSASVFLWSLMTLLMGFSKQYWHLVLLRFGQGISEAGCTPFAISLIVDYFPKVTRGSAIGFYNWGIYAGYSLSYAIGNYVTRANILGQGWRWAFFLSALPGFVVSAVLLLTVREAATRRGSASTHGLGLRHKLVQGLRPFLRPSLLLFSFAGSVRNAAGYVWAYNTQVYFNLYFSGVDVGRWLSWIPLVGGCIGAVAGGLIADQLVKRRGLYARVWVLVVSQVAAAPFVAGALWLKPPYSFISLIPANIIGEMGIGVALTIVVELVAPAVRTPVVAIYIFIISNIGGNAPLLVTPLTRRWSLRLALLVLCPGMFVAGSLLFLLSLVLMRWDQKLVCEEESQPLLGFESFDLDQRTPSEVELYEDF
ncbi:probable galactarate/D-glucarate transporter GarP isoform X1 [Leucoraja erinacea]|uniref:probable galactarate/D-glucarate transporter GarP isoform X1 n=1 Tax=Leucoraja erinaceus TaxID=7782 RepID=UPI002455874D|nr:probable galactarate/D-glucarate transporter GarP isoform X1 [Leucoraja erinacea]